MPGRRVAESSTHRGRVPARRIDLASVDRGSGPARRVRIPSADRRPFPARRVVNSSSDRGVVLGRRVEASSVDRGPPSACDIILVPDYCGTAPGDCVMEASHNTTMIRVSVVRPNDDIMGARLFAVMPVLIITNDKIAESISRRSV